ncbi:MAG TPA: hypothetical protein VE974_02520 [Thermoanaerobaculia bacterium]|nr:hypothetical protein [Thermoanaerobaculia bacterium]
MTNIPVEPTPNYQQIAEQIIAEMRAAVQKIPGYAPLPPGRRRKTSRNASIPDKAFHAAALTCDSHPDVAAPAKMSGERIRDAIQHTDAFQSVIKEMDVLRESAYDTIQRYRAEVAAGVRKVYKVAKGVSSPDEEETLVPHLPAMKEAFKRKKRPAAPEGEPASPIVVKPS